MYMYMYIYIYACCRYQALFTLAGIQPTTWYMGVFENGRGIYFPLHGHQIMGNTMISQRMEWVAYFQTKPEMMVV